MDLRIDHVGLICRDLKAALQTYQVAFGNELVERRFEPGECEVARVGAGCDVTVELIGPPFHHDEESHIGRHGYSIHHVGFLVSDVDVAYQQLVSQGVQSVCPPMNLMGMRQCRLADPDGLQFEIGTSFAPIVPRQARAAADRDTSARLRTHHISILTHDLRRSQRFYERLLGLRTVYEYIEDDGGFIFLADPFYDPSNHNFMLEIIGPPYLEPREKVLLDARGPCYDHFCYTADDVPAAWEQAAARGSVRVEAPVEAYDNCLAWLRDADGNDIEVMGAVPPEIILEAIRTGVPYDSTRSPKAAIQEGE